ncbi:hypothetical protein GALMADRAFT_237493 [Galerina marginata CBS 339.88]|uniref:Ubiquitin-like domain-containing protein n=1 Tax=Galerina marginata (strain CBS 339.88) TaxID=685588 RepID=A0A067TXA5_GALM3|nr:hypothetical protein GALMADRAFT_237493 [Galerina marginata CBS 339.88]
MSLKHEWTAAIANMSTILQKRNGEEDLGHSKPATEACDGPDLPTATLISHSLPVSTMGLIIRPSLIQANDVSPDSPSELAHSTYIRPAETSLNDSWSRQAFQVANVGLSIISPLVGAVPVVGSPAKAAIDGLLVVLNAIDQIGQNKQDVQNLRSKLHRLANQISVIPAAGSDFGTSRDCLTRRLNETTKKLRVLCDRPRFHYVSVAKEIKQCSQDVDSHLLEFSALNNMQLVSYAEKNDKRVEGMARQIESMAMTLQATRALTQQMLLKLSTGFIELQDATGRSHPIPMDMARSLRQFSAAMSAVFDSKTAQGSLLLRYMGTREYILSITNGDGQVHQITNEEDWLRLQPGTTVTMSIILVKDGTRYREYLCPFCKVWNDVVEQPNGSSLDCLGCRRQFQITVTYQRLTHKPESKEGKLDGRWAGIDEDLNLIRNVHLKQYASQPFLISSCCSDFQNVRISISRASQSFLISSCCSNSQAAMNNCAYFA